jgi:heme A synthase
MVMILGFLISFAAGWSIAAADALFRAEERPGLFRGAPGMILLLIVAGIGGLTIAYAMIWFLQSMISAAVLVILAAGLVLGSAASKKLHVNPAGAVNRMMAGLAALIVLYAVVWTWLPPEPPKPPPSETTSPTTPSAPLSK